MKRIYRYLPFVLVLSCAPLARAQGSFDVALGFGTERAKATGTGIDENTLSPCIPSSTDTTCQATPALGGLFMGFEGDAMLNKHIGIAGEINFQPSKGTYGPLQFRELFYDFGGLYAPINHKKFQVRVEGGVGGAHFGSSFTESSCIGTLCQTETIPFASANHFQVHIGAGVQVYVKGHFFVRPEFDFREVPGMSNQFNTDHVIGGTIWFGYNFGEM